MLKMICVLWFLGVLIGCKTSEVSEPFETTGLSKRGDRQSFCHAELTSQLEKDFGQLIQCAVQHNCLGSVNQVYCGPCQNNANGAYFGAYIYPYGTLSLVRPHIRICEEAISSKGGKYTESFLEEAYHAVTICARGREVHPLLGKVRRDLEQQVSKESLSKKQSECVQCLVQEMFAKRCAGLREGANPYDNKNIFAPLQSVITAESSCNDYCPGTTHLSTEKMRELPEIKAAIAIYPSLDQSCEEVNQSCGVNAAIISREGER